MRVTGKVVGGMIIIQTGDNTYITPVSTREVVRPPMPVSRAVREEPIRYSVGVPQFMKERSQRMQVRRRLQEAM